MRGEQFPGMKLPGQDTQTGSNNLIGVGLDGRVKISELPLTYSHAAKVKVTDTHWPKWQGDRMQEHCNKTIIQESK